MSRFTPARGVAVAAALVALLASTGAHADEPESGDPLSGPIDRFTVAREAVSRHPGVHAAEMRAHATSTMASSAGRLPPPEAMLQIWQVPLSRPYAVNDAGMVMVGLSQMFPPAGVRGARERAGEHMAEAGRAMATDRARMIRREAEHAFIDYVESAAHERIHVEHRALAERALGLARARLSGGGSLTDVTQAEVELARVQADVISDASRTMSARARLNTLLLRPANAPLGAPIEGEPEIAMWDLSTIICKAEDARPEIRVAEAEHAARAEEARATAQEAKMPTFSVAALYFAPVGPMPVHGYGANASMSLPWLWGEASTRRDAAKEQAEAAGAEARASRIPIKADVAMADANMRASATRLQALRDLALPASRRSFEAVWAGYEAGRTDILTVVMAQRSIVDIQSDVVAARASLDHALTDLDASVGADVPRRALGPLDSTALGEGHSHGH